MSEDPAEFMRRYAENTDAHRLEATLAMIADDAVYLFSDGTSHVGKAVIADVLAKNFAAITDETYRIGDLRWLLRTSDAATCVYVFDWSGVIDGKPAAGGGRGTSVLRRDGESWLVVHEHLSKGGLG
jgi:ketosteroid isomerase-like protein